MTPNEVKLVEMANAAHNRTIHTEHYIQLESQPPINITFKDNQFIAIEYWWEDQDFIFVTDKGDKYRCGNAYPISMSMEGLDYTNDETMTVTLHTIRKGRFNMKKVTICIIVFFLSFPCGCDRIQNFFSDPPPPPKPPPVFYGEQADIRVDFDLVGEWSATRFGTKEEPGKLGKWSKHYNLKRIGNTLTWKDEDGQGEFSPISPNISNG